MLQWVHKKSKHKLIEGFIYLLIILFTIITAVLYSKENFGYNRYDNSTLSYNKGKVLKIKEQKLTLDQTSDYLTGYQLDTIKFLDGKEKGKEIDVRNDVTATHNIISKVGQTLIICSDTPENVEAYYTVYNYYRSPAIWLILVFFLLLIAVVGGKKGIRSAISLLFTMFMMICFLLPLLYHGASPILTTSLSITISIVVTLYLLNGLSIRTLFDVLSTTTGMIMAGILFYLMSRLLVISGYQTEEAESLILIANETGLHIKGILFAGVLTASLGAVMDVGVSIGASLHELWKMNPLVTSKSLFLSGMNIGKDMIGTMTNTLILAFAGSSLMTLLIFISYGIQYHQLLSSDYLATEIAEAVAGSAAVVIMVPVTSALCAFGYPLLKKKFGGKL